jgi:hypothetical protein
VTTTFFSTTSIPSAKQGGWRGPQRSTGLVLLDVEKAFDSVWPEGLLHKFVISSYYFYFTKIIASTLNGRSFHVCMNKTNSATHPPQGAILSPSLYITSLQSECETVTCADDTAILVSDGNPNIVCTGLQGHLVTLCTYFEQWKIQINASKTQEIYFTHYWAPKKLSSANISIGGHPIP